MGRSERMRCLARGEDDGERGEAGRNRLARAADVSKIAATWRSGQPATGAVRCEARLALAWTRWDPRRRPPPPRQSDASQPPGCAAWSPVRPLVSVRAHRDGTPQQQVGVGWARRRSPSRCWRSRAAVRALARSRGPDLPAKPAAKTGVDEPIRREPPISLTAADGAELALRCCECGAVLDQPLAFTELELALRQPGGPHCWPAAWRWRSAPGARDPLRGVPRRRVARGRGGAAAHGDPAAGAGPRAAGAAAGRRAGGRALRGAASSRSRRGEQTRLIVAYTQEMRGRSEPYRVPVAGLAPLRELAVALRSRSPLVMGGDPLFAGVRGDGEVLPLRRRATDRRHRRCSRTGRARAGPAPRQHGGGPDLADPHDHLDPVESLAILFDTSASQALGWDTHVDRLGQVIQELGARVLEDIPLRVVAFDQGAGLAYEGPIRSGSARPSWRRSARGGRSARRTCWGRCAAPGSAARSGRRGACW